MSRRGAQLGLASLSALIGLLVVELGVRVALPAPRFHPHPPQHTPGLLRAHVERGYENAPGVVGRMRGYPPHAEVEFDVAVRTDVRGLRIPSAGRPDGEPDRRLLAVGDSFTFGWGVEAEETWAARATAGLASASGDRIQLWNAGVTAYGMGQMRRTALEFVEQARFDAVLLGLMPEEYDRVVRPFGVLADALVREDERHRTRSVDPGVLRSPFDDPALARFDLTLARFWHTGAHLVELTRGRRGGAGARAGAAGFDGRALEPLFAELDALTTELHAAETPLVVVLVMWPRRIDSQESRAIRERTIEYAKARGITVYDPTPMLADLADTETISLGSRDGHWTAVAHAAVGRGLAHFLVERGF